MHIQSYFLQHAFRALLLTWFLASSGLAARAEKGGAAGRPNVIVICSDDQGYADLGLHNLRKDIKTPNLDALARSGVLFTEGYATSPQCTPSRAGLLTGRYQQRFGLDSISGAPLPSEEKTLAQRLHRAGYATGMAGKWHLSMPGTVTIGMGETPEARAAELPYAPGARGFEDFFWGNWYDYWANYAPDGRALDRVGEAVKYDHKKVENYYTDLQTEAALSFIRRQDQKPFFFYLAYLAPHTPLRATREYLNRFPGEMAERRRAALAMISAVDDGVGRIMALLEEKGMRENTIIFYISDNGAPLGANVDAPLADIMPITTPKGIWGGSLNEPLRGEKGMLSEGGIRVPFIMSWPGRVPAGTVFRQPVTALDVAPTVLAAAHLPADPKVDGLNLSPYLVGRGKAMPERDLFWRFWNQTAVRSGDWKLILAGNYKLLFNLKDDLGETKNVIGEQAVLAKALEKKLAAWNDELKPPGIPRKPLNGQERRMYGYHFGDPESPESPEVPRLPDTSAGDTLASRVASVQAARLETLFHFDKIPGTLPEHGVIITGDGKLYVSSATGGSSGVGVVFRLSPKGEFTALAQFDWATGTRPRARLVQARNGSFYGVTSSGGYSNDGTVFSMAPDGKLQVLSHLIGLGKLARPSAALVEGRDGNFYGTSSSGGGTIYRVTPTGAVSTMVEFNGRDGDTPVDELTQGSDGNFYGTTMLGGKFGLGTVFRVTTSGLLTVLFDFDGYSGAKPMCKLVQALDGSLYGTTSEGGRADAGTLFRITPQGALKTLFQFSGANGRNPAAGLILGRDGNFYGTTSLGGRSNLGTLFRFTPAGTLTTLAHFNGPNGSRPMALPIQSSDNSLYGTTRRGGRNDGGTVYRIFLGKGVLPLPVVAITTPVVGGSTSARRISIEGTAAGTVKMAKVQVRTQSPTGVLGAWSDTKLRGDGAHEKWKQGAELPTAGQWQVQARVIDADGKRSGIVTRAILVDRKSPSIRVDTPIVSHVSASERRLIIRGRASDDSAPAAMQYRVRSESGKFGNWQRTSLSGKGSSRTLSHPVSLPGPGTWTVEVRVVDGAGNLSRSMIRNVIVNRPHPGSIPTAPTTRPTVKYSQGDPTSLEQFMLEMLNRSRANPTVEARRLRMDLGSGLPAGAVTAARKQPLALHPLLVLAARDHSRWLAQGYELGHSGAGGSTPAQRAVARGFKFGVAENVSQVGSTGTIEPIWAINNSHDGLFESPGHRTNILDPTASVVGVGIVSGKRPDDPPFMIGVKGMLFTQKFSSGDTDQTGAFITGVAFDDKDGDGFYSLGEGLAGIEVRPAWGKYYAVTSKSGGFAIPLAALGRQPGVVTVNLPFPVAPRDAWKKAKPYDEKFRAEQIRKAPPMDMELRWTSKKAGLSLKSKVTIKRPMLIEYRLMGTDGMFFPRTMITSSSAKADLVYTKGKPRVVMP